jgi:hypothetical protein
MWKKDLKTSVTRKQTEKTETISLFSTRPAHKAIFDKCFSHQDRDTLKYERIKNQLQRNALLYLPIFDILKGVSKDNTRKVLVDLLQEQALVSNKQELKQTSDDLWMVMTNFEV